VVLALLFSSSVADSVREHIRAGWDGHLCALVDALSTPERPLPPEMARLMLAPARELLRNWLEAAPLA